MKHPITIPRWMALMFAALIILLAVALAAAAWSLALHGNRNVDGTVVGFMIGTVEDQPISRWYAMVDTRNGEQLVEIGPALYMLECFEVGDHYAAGSLGRCEDVVWP